MSPMMEYGVGESETELKRATNLLFLCVLKVTRLVAFRIPLVDKMPLAPLRCSATLLF